MRSALCVLKGRPHAPNAQMASDSKIMHVNPALRVAKFVQHQRVLPAWMIGTRLPIVPVLGALKFARHVQETRRIVILAIKGLRPTL